MSLWPFTQLKSDYIPWANNTLYLSCSSTGPNVDLLNHHESNKICNKLISARLHISNTLVLVSIIQTVFLRMNKDSKKSYIDHLRQSFGLRIKLLKCGRCDDVVDVLNICKQIYIIHDFYQADDLRLTFKFGKLIHV